MSRVRLDFPNMILCADQHIRMHALLRRRHAVFEFLIAAEPLNLLFRVWQEAANSRYGRGIDKGLERGSSGSEMRKELGTLNCNLLRHRM